MTTSTHDTSSDGPVAHLAVAASPGGIEAQEALPRAWAIIEALDETA